MKLSRKLHTGAPNPTENQEINGKPQTNDCHPDAQPLLSDEVNNDIVTEFFSSTLQARSNILNGSLGPLHLPPQRSITSPQHPTQDLLETLNMHQYQGQKLAAARRKQKRQQEILAQNSEHIRQLGHTLQNPRSNVDAGVSANGAASSSSASSSPSLSSFSSSPPPSSFSSTKRPQ
ncbi:zinc finger and BTB domain-containing protein 4-like [Argonauta hians]